MKVKLLDNYMPIRSESTSISDDLFCDWFQLVIISMNIHMSVIHVITDNYTANQLWTNPINESFKLGNMTRNVSLIWFNRILLDRTILR